MIVLAEVAYHAIAMEVKRMVKSPLEGKLHEVIIMTLTHVSVTA